MFKLSFESEFNKKSELLSDLENLIWQVKYLWPVGVMSANQIKWIQSIVNKSVLKKDIAEIVSKSPKLKLNYGSQKIDIEISNTATNNSSSAISELAKKFISEMPLKDNGKKLIAAFAVWVQKQHTC